MDERLYLTASDIVVPEKLNEIFLSVKMRICSTRGNGNSEGVTGAFIEEIVEHQEKYMSLPLYVDSERQLNKEYRSLGHMFNRATRQFATTQVGGFVGFEKVEDSYGTSLFGEARIPKRETEICERIMELYDLGWLNFSFEIRYVKTDCVTINGVRYVDASDNNALTGVAIVSVPAYPESTAVSLVAEQNQDGEGKPDPQVIQEEDNKEDGQNERNDNVDKNMTVEQALEAINVKDTKIAELEEKVNGLEDEKKDLVEDKTAMENEKKEKEEALTVAEAEKAKVSEELTAANASLAEKEQTIAELNEKVKTLEVAKAELDEVKARQAEEAKKVKQEQAKAFAEKQGLDIEKEDVMKAIAEMDYEKIASLSMENYKKEDNTVQIASFYTDGMTIKDEYNGVLDRA